MKVTLKVGDKVTVNTGKFAGKEDVVSFIDKKTYRVRLEKLKKTKAKSKKGGAVELHGTFHISSLTAIKPAAAETTEAAPAA